MENELAQDTEGNHSYFTPLDMTLQYNTNLQEVMGLSQA